jgi:hypothetical protein
LLFKENLPIYKDLQTSLDIITQQDVIEFFFIKAKKGGCKEQHTQTIYITKRLITNGEDIDQKLH